MQNMSSMVRQAQKMQAQIAKLQEEIGLKEVEASTGGGMVIAVVNGKQELISVKINPEVANPEDVEDLEIMIVGAINQAMKTAGEMMDREVGKITGGFSIPGLTS